MLTFTYFWNERTADDQASARPPTRAPDPPDDGRGNPSDQWATRKARCDRLGGDVGAGGQQSAATGATSAAGHGGDDPDGARAAG